MYDGLVIAKGIVHYNASDIQAIKGYKSEDISHILGHEGVYEEVVHRDNLVIMQ